MKDRSESRWIVLDIDGTITEKKDSVPQEVQDYLSMLVHKGWKIAFATGRAFIFAQKALKQFEFPYLFIVQNGSLALKMPEKELLIKRYLSGANVVQLLKIFEPFGREFLVYAGYEKNDFCYYRKNRFSKEDVPYLRELMGRENKNWVSVDAFIEEDSYPLVKSFGKLEVMKKIQRAIDSTGFYTTALIQEPFDPGQAILLITAKGVNKGETFHRITENRKETGFVIAAGDDENDLSLFDYADVKIAMPHAPLALKERADQIAPPTRVHGIIKALQEAIDQHWNFDARN